MFDCLPFKQKVSSSLNDFIGKSPNSNLSKTIFEIVPAFEAVL